MSILFPADFPVSQYALFANYTININTKTRILCVNILTFICDNNIDRDIAHVRSVLENPYMPMLLMFSSIN
jgi:hypothetical protein